VTPIISISKCFLPFPQSLPSLLTLARCGPCKLISPVFDALSEEISTNEAVFLKVDVDVNEVMKGWGGRN